jgi:hypothetical protein
MSSTTKSFVNQHRFLSYGVEAQAVVVRLTIATAPSRPLKSVPPRLRRFTV